MAPLPIKIITSEAIPEGKILIVGNKVTAPWDRSILEMLLNCNESKKAIDDELLKHAGLVINIGAEQDV